MADLKTKPLFLRAAEAIVRATYPDNISFPSHEILPCATAIYSQLQISSAADNGKGTILFYLSIVGGQAADSLSANQHLESVFHICCVKIFKVF